MAALRGIWRRLAAWWRTLRGPRDPVGVRLAPAQVRRYGAYMALQFRRGQTQSRMRVDDPDHLLIDYTRTMLGCLLWRPRPARIGIIGLGGGSQVKFCHRNFRSTAIEVVENHPGVLALRRTFGVPDDDDRLSVVLDDGARFMRARRGCFDLLLVDGYDALGIPAALSTQAWYDDCRDALVPGGAVAVNLFCDDAGLHVERLRTAFGTGRVVVLGEARMQNRVAFAWVPATSGAAAVPDPSRAAVMLPAAVRGELAPVLARVAAVAAAGRVA